MFGLEAVKMLDYVECFPEGAGKGRKMSKVCTDAAIEGFPTWIIKDKVYRVSFIRALWFSHIFSYISCSSMKDKTVTLALQFQECYFSQNSFCFCSILFIRTYAYFLFSLFLK